MSKKICPVCGRMETEDAAYCRDCGAKTVDYDGNIPYQQPIGSESGNRANGLQIAGLVCGILAICSCCCYGAPALLLGIAGLICAVLGNKQNKCGVGTAGLICSIIGLVLGGIAVIYYIWVIIYVGSNGWIYRNAGTNAGIFALGNVVHMFGVSASGNVRAVMHWHIG